MKKWLTQIGLFFLLLFVVDKLLLCIIEINPSLEADQKLEKVLQGKIGVEVLALGSSRCTRSFAAQKFETLSGLTTYNAGFAGSNIDFQSFVFDLYLTHQKKPQWLILTIDDPLQLVQNESIKFRTDRLYPLIKYPEIKSKLIELGEKNEILCHVFVAHQLSFKSVLPIQKHFSTIDSIQSDGSMLVNGTKLSGQVFDTLPKHYVRKVESPKLRVAFRKIIDRCRKENIHLMLCFPPNTRPFSKGFIERIQDFTRKDKVKYFIDSSFNSSTKHTTYFFDESHLNRRGARVFTEHLFEFFQKQRLQEALNHKKDTIGTISIR
jgi:hypothetical protein